jgi:periplasmic protein TonB
VSLGAVRSPRPHGARLGGGIVASALVHAALSALVFWWAAQPEPVRPPVYRVELVGQIGPRQTGVEESNTPAAKAPDVAGAERVPEEKAAPVKSRSKAPAVTPKATPSPVRSKKGGAKTASTTSKATAAPKAGAGANGGSAGADVANVKTGGIDFPYPGYLNNVVRQIALNWNPSKVSASLISEVKFTIRRDGTVLGIEVTKRSGDRLYDVDAMGAIEAVGSTKGFGPLPTGWNDDVLVVYFTFDYALRPR